MLENKVMKVRYKYLSENYDGDLVCELTEFMDQYLLGGKLKSYMCTYLYNDLTIFSKPKYLQIAFRYPRCYKRWNYITKVRYK